MADYAVVDVETSGFNPPKAEVVELALVHVDGSGRITGRWDTLVRPRGAVGATHVHGISAAMVHRAPAFESIAERVHALLAGRVVVAHNLPFDARFLVAEFARAGIEAPEVPGGVCTLSTARRYLPVPTHKLADCCAYAQVPLVDAHKALGDATATAGLLGYFLGRGIPLGGTPVRGQAVPPPRRSAETGVFHPRVV